MIIKKNLKKNYNYFSIISSTVIKLIIETCYNVN
ncbi:MAG: hypothetical protein Edafosvirus3_65 [Edafosvirus sp.]|uniref:Uncharacterized protein n=1 Tax=Edafosvirus sp. TaxID=2487765 RepID=A0A3G4ZSX8_9VIRU|nr:MAG: hypothetical protein Edafosvirus3_65 [Edafosvirus sp.]